MANDNNQVGLSKEEIQSLREQFQEEIKSKQKTIKSTNGARKKLAVADQKKLKKDLKLLNKIDGEQKKLSKLDSNSEKYIKVKNSISENINQLNKYEPPKSAFENQQTHSESAAEGISRTSKRIKSEWNNIKGQEPGNHTERLEAYISKIELEAGTLSKYLNDDGIQSIINPINNVIQDEDIKFTTEERNKLKSLSCTLESNLKGCLLPNSLDSDSQIFSGSGVSEDLHKKLFETINDARLNLQGKHDKSKYTDNLKKEALNIAENKRFANDLEKKNYTEGIEYLINKRSSNQLEDVNKDAEIQKSISNMIQDSNNLLNTQFPQLKYTDLTNKELIGKMSTGLGDEVLNEPYFKDKQDLTKELKTLDQDLRSSNTVNEDQTKNLPPEEKIHDQSTEKTSSTNKDLIETLKENPLFQEQQKKNVNNSKAGEHSENNSPITSKNPTSNFTEQNERKNPLFEGQETNNVNSPEVGKNSQKNLPNTSKNTNFNIATEKKPLIDISIKKTIGKIKESIKNISKDQFKNPFKGKNNAKGNSR